MSKTRCYRTDCDCLSPGFYSEFESEIAAERHIEKEHQKLNHPMLIVSVDKSTCNHPRHNKERKKHG